MGVLGREHPVHKVAEEDRCSLWTGHCPLPSRSLSHSSWAACFLHTCSLLPQGLCTCRSLSWNILPAAKPPRSTHLFTHPSLSAQRSEKRTFLTLSVPSATYSHNPEFFLYGISYVTLGGEYFCQDLRNVALPLWMASTVAGGGRKARVQLGHQGVPVPCTHLACVGAQHTQED